jgi:hypothetical protein
MNIYLIDTQGALIGPVELQEIPGLGIQLPGNAISLTDSLPDAEVGKAWALVEGQPVLLQDNRGAVYSTSTGVRENWQLLGELPAGVTAQPFPGPYFVWSGTAWALDQNAKLAAETAHALAERDERMQVATARIAPLQDAVDLGEATANEEPLLLAWKRYRVALNRIQQQSGFPVDIVWPDTPAA